MQPTQEVDNLKALTGLRFVAAMMIVLHHAQATFPWAFLKFVPGTFFQGVSAFFVLSGFILTHVYCSKPMLGYGAFIRARYARLLPVHVAATALLGLAVPMVSATFDGPGLLDKWIVLGVNLAMLHSIVPVIGYSFSWNAVSWSISTEMFFYLVFPLLIINIRRTWHWKLLGAFLLMVTLIAAVALSGVPRDFNGIEHLNAISLVYPSPLTHGVEFVLGMAAWVVWDRHVRHLDLSKRAWSIIEAVVLSFAAFWLLFAFDFLSDQLANPWADLFLDQGGSCWLFAILITLFASSRGYLARVLSTRAVVFLGDISFSIYLFHQVLNKIFLATFEWPEVPALVYLPVLFAISAASYLLIERPGQRLLLGKAGRKPTHPLQTSAA